MNTTRNHAGTLALIATAVLGGGLQVAMANDAPPAPYAMDHHEHAPRWQHDGPEGGFMHVLHDLDLSSDQKQKIHALLGNAREQWRSESARDHGEFAALANPGDPGHQAAVQAAKARAAERIDHFSEVQQQVYALLTPAQQAKLPQVLAEVQKERAARHPAGAPPPPPTPAP